MYLTERQKHIVQEAREVLDRVKRDGGSLRTLSRDDTDILLSAMAIIEEHDEDPPLKRLNDILDEHFGPS